MVLDINLFRKEKGGNPLKLKESERNRFHDETNVDKVIEYDEKWRKCIFELEELKKKINSINKEIGNIKKLDKNADVEKLKKASISLKNEIPVIQNEEKYLLKERNCYLQKIGNILNKNVVISNDEINNKIIKTWGESKKFTVTENEDEIEIEKGQEKKSKQESPGNKTKLTSVTNVGKTKYYHHFDLLLKIGGANFRKGIHVAGHRGYYLTGMGFLLHNAILQYALNFLLQKNYNPVYPPFFMRKHIMEECAELVDFDETLYKIPMGCTNEIKKEEFFSTINNIKENNNNNIKENNNNNIKENNNNQNNQNILKKNINSINGKCKNTQTEEDDRDDLFLIATSEQPLCALHKDEIIESKNLPLKYVGISSCFRKEAGAHGKDIRGIFRVHQFDKIEQFCITLPQFSNKMHEEMIKTCEEFYQSLNIPYRIVSIVSGALNNAASLKYDIEGHFPSFNEYKELVSCSNCTDYLSINLNVRYTDSSVKVQKQSEHKTETEKKETTEDDSTNFIKKNNIDTNNIDTDEIDSDYENFTKHFQTENKNYVHLLNGTMVAAQRCLCCILENYQNGKGIVVPEKLRPYMNNIDFIPFL